MKRILLLTALLALLATSAVLAAVPPSIWFQDNFDTYVVNTRLAYCLGWGASGVIEPGMLASWPAKNVDCQIKTAAYCSAGQSVMMQGYRPAETDRTLSDPSATCAQTTVSWAAYAAGSVQILNFKMVKSAVTNQEPFPPLHATVFLMDNNVFGAQPIMGWTFSTTLAKPQLNLPTYMGPTWTTNRYFSPEGTTYNWSSDPVGTCREFTAVYDPASGDAKFYVNISGTDTLLWTGAAGTGRVSQSVYVRDFIWTPGGGPVDVVNLDDLSVGTTAKPVLTAPLGGVFKDTATPAITWNKAFPLLTRTNYQVKVCASDSSSAAAVTNGDSGVRTDGLTSWTPSAALPTNTQLWAFVTETYSAPTGYSLGGNGGFYCVTSVPTTPTVTSPSGDGFVGAKPSVNFSGGVLHNQFEVKITTDSGGSTIVWTSGPVSSLKNGASCEELLTAGTQYYAFAQATNPVGPSAWSAASAFKVTRVGEGTDIREMQETWGAQSVLEHAAAAPDDGFGTYVGSGSTWALVKRQILPDPLLRYADRTGKYPTNTGLVTGTPVPCDWWPSGSSGDCDGNTIAYCDGLFLTPYTGITGPNPPRTAPSSIMDLWSTVDSNNANCMRAHRVANIDLDKGVTFLTYASNHTYEGEGGGVWAGRNIAEGGQVYIMDDYGTGKCMASFNYGKGQAGICANGTTWTQVYYTDDQHLPDVRPGQGWHLVRITGRNAIVGDYTSTVWKYYLDEIATPLTTATGSIDQAYAGWAWPSDPVPVGDAIAIGNGAGRWYGDYQYDWTAVNTAGDYRPGEWYPFSRTFATVSEAAAGGGGSVATITGNAVITAVQMDGATQVGFWVQDVGSDDRRNILILTSTTTNVEVGRKVTGISGLMGPETGVGGNSVQAVPAMKNASFTIGALPLEDYLPLAMNQKALVAGGLVDQYPDGTNTTARFVRIVGRVTEIYGDAIYLDDGSGLNDGRSADGNPAVAGVRIMDTAISFSGSIGDYYRVDGICASDKWVEGATNKRVRTILAPTFTLIPEP